MSTTLSLADIAFRDPDRALANLTQLASDVPEGVLTLIRIMLASAADPDTALHQLERLQRARPAAFHRFARSPALLRALIALFSQSRFLSEETIQRPEAFESAVTGGDFARLLGADELAARLVSSLKDEAIPDPLELARFRRHQILRILLRDALGQASLADTTVELSHLADALMEVTYSRIRADLVRRYGTPRHGENRECGFSVIALGKLGGNELNYSSDIDLMFIYSANGETDGPAPISNKEFFKKAANQFTSLLSTYSGSGMCYRVDLRLRPDGRLGEVAISLDGARSYYANRARDWELQMMIKARVAAGERAAGRELLEFVEPLTYSTTTDFSAVEAVSATRERLQEKLAARRASAGFDIKLARGGIRDIEFLVQCLQRLHGGREPWLRHASTLQALTRLHDKDRLSAAEHSRLAVAYRFLRNLEHRLQFADDLQTHTMPEKPDELDLLARRMPASDVGEQPSGESLLRKLNAHLEGVQEIYERVIHAQQPIYYTVRHAEESVPIQELVGVASDASATNLVRFLDVRAPALAELLNRNAPKRGARHFEAFLEKVQAKPELLSALNSDTVLAADIVDLFEHSPYFAEQLIRNPEWIAIVGEMRRRQADRMWSLDEAGAIEDPTELRRYFQREMLRIQSESICRQANIFTTLARTSELTDGVVRAAYRLAVESVALERPPADPAYEPHEQMSVIALGRLGMREFDLASDADLVFVIPDRDASEYVFWTRVAERMIGVLTAYTGDGVLFAVDTRLRPNGREGALVQTESTYKEYFAQRAEAWEGITYMKSRAAAGNLDHGTEFLNELQQLDWRRYGQSGRSQKQLRAMRMRLEKEQGAENPLKAGMGGYYDIDFALMYLRLKGAGIFFKVLNTPERIDVIEKMGHLERNDADFLRDAATFYRAVDHGLRVFSGHTEGTLPSAPTQLAALTALVGRWTPDHLHDQPLEVELAQIRTRTREYFERLFGTH